MILLIDNYDSFVHNLARYLERLGQETLVVRNPSRATYVGDASAGFATTLALGIPESFERVTFHREFFGRRFHVVNGRLVTDVPWTPGERTLKFTYYLPMTESRYALARPLDLPCSGVRVRVRGADAAGRSGGVASPRRGPRTAVACARWSPLGTRRGASSPWKSTTWAARYSPSLDRSPN